MDEKTKKSTNGKGTKFNRRMVSAIAAAAVATGGLFGAQALAGSNAYRHLKLAAGDRVWRGGWHGHGGFADLSDAEIEDRVGRMVRHVSIEIDATEEQEVRLVELATSAARELKPLREQIRASRQEFHDLLMADSIDRGALDALRTERLAEFDRVSKSLVDTLADMAEVLTPAQRGLLEERIREFRSMHKGWRRG